VRLLLASGVERESILEALLKVADDLALAGATGRSGWGGAAS
jgi:hypothetical protein